MEAEIVEIDDVNNEFELEIDYYNIETRLFLEKFSTIFLMQNLEYHNIYA